MSAADEKAAIARQQQMADEARMQSVPDSSVGQTQRNAGNSLAQVPEQQTTHSQAQQAQTMSHWLTAEEEKRKQQLQGKLFQEAKHVAEATQASVGNPDVCLCERTTLISY